MAFKRGKDRIRRHPCIEGVTLVKTARGQNVWMDDADVHLLEDRSLCIGSHGYPTFGTPDHGVTVKHLLHRKVLPLGPELEVDHLNGNKLDARRINLRPVTKAQNSQNRHRPRRGASGILGVRRQPSKKHPWLAEICVDKKVMRLGNFANQAEALECRRAAELQHFGRHCPR